MTIKFLDEIAETCKMFATEYIEVHGQPDSHK